MAGRHTSTTLFRTLHARAGFTVASGLTLVVLAFLVVLLPQQAHAGTVAKGIVDHRLQYSNRVPLAEIPQYADEVAATGATWTRVFVRWNYLQPEAPGEAHAGDADGNGYEDHYEAELDLVIQALYDRGLKVMLCANDVPRWAANSKYAKGKLVTSAVMRTGDPVVMRQFKRFAKYMAGHFRQWGVTHLEVWNEPNLSSGIYPQIVNKKAVGPAAYIRMLKTFYLGAHAANSSAVVIAGATSRFGSNGNDDGSTSPQWFASYLKSHGARKWFDAYSHHPYTKIGSDPRPSVPPREPKKAVTLGNISVLLKIFPRTDFYLTEFCYSTARVRDLFCVVVTQADQARYLRQAWSWVERYPRIKAMMWFLVRDWEKDPVNTPGVGVCTGLLEADGTPKPSWYAFVGDNELTASAPQSVAAGESFSVGGRLTHSSACVAGAAVLLQRAPVVGGSWSTVTTPVIETDANGDYAFSVAQTQSWRYRAVYDGVIESAPVTVSVP